MQNNKKQNEDEKIYDFYIIPNGCCIHSSWAKQ